MICKKDEIVFPFFSVVTSASALSRLDISKILFPLEAHTQRRPLRSAPPIFIIFWWYNKNNGVVERYTNERNCCELCEI